MCSRDERRRERERDPPYVQLTHWHQRWSNWTFLRTRGRGRRRRTEKERGGKRTILFLSLISVFLLLSPIHSVFLQFIEMINRSRWIFFLLGYLSFTFAHVHSIPDSTHQIFQVDLGQDVTLSCLFDPWKVEQVGEEENRRDSSREREREKRESMVDVDRSVKRD